MERHIEIETTEDGSHTLYVPSMDEHYHSVRGAMQESMHVFIDAGLCCTIKDEISILEIGFGTGLNAIMTLQKAREQQMKVHYYSFELYPLSADIIRSLNYTELMDAGDGMLYNKLHATAWNATVAITNLFDLTKLEADFSLLNTFPKRLFDLIYFDAFAPDKQPEMWTQDIFDFLYKHTEEEGILTTYCAKGSVRRMLQQSGYKVERLAGPPGKREMLRARK